MTMIMTNDYDYNYEELRTSRKSSRISATSISAQLL